MGSDWRRSPSSLSPSSWRTAAASAMPPRYDSPEHWDATRAQEDLDFHMKHGGVGGPMPEERKPGRKGKLSFVDKEQIDFIRFGAWMRAEGTTRIHRTTCADGNCVDEEDGKLCEDDRRRCRPRRVVACFQPRTRARDRNHAKRAPALDHLHLADPFRYVDEPQPRKRTYGTTGTGCCVCEDHAHCLCCVNAG